MARSLYTSAEAYEALSEQTERHAAVASATGSVKAEGLRTSEAADRDVEAYERGHLDINGLIARTIGRYLRPDRQAG